MEEKISYRVVDNDVVRRINLKGRGIKTSKLPIPNWIDRNQPGINIYDLAWLSSSERPRVRSSAQEIRAVDLFCGCGGLTLGIREAARGLGCSFRSVFASDINKSALGIYAKNFQPDIIDNNPIENSINGELGAELTVEETVFCNKVGNIDILVAGPPCQGHSNLNNYTRRDDPRNLLYLRAVRCAEILKPNTLIIENVPGVVHDKHGVLQRADEYLKTIGYSVSYGVVKMWTIGVAQTRQRMLLIASRVMQNVSLENIVKKASLPPRSMQWVIGDLQYQYDADSIFNSAAIHSPINQARIHYLFEHNLYELPNSERPDCHRLKPHTYPAVYGRMHWDRPSPTITGGFACCGRGRFVHPLYERTLTPHEAARIQYFPDFFDFGNLGRTELVRAIGNAVPARAGYVVALPLLIAALENEQPNNNLVMPANQ
ncbi:MAG: DNA cytosine methyltransferase [Kiritimatiellae bacterium]|nr:DNA cytosine methyltransferase [Kiritimatiellia bacterium]